MQTFKKVLNIIIDVLVVILLLFSTLTAYISLSSASTGVPNFFGNTFMSVQTGSMIPTFNPGDLILGKTVDQNTEYKVDDIITFKVQSLEGNTVLNSHRIIDIKETDGVTLYFTKGDNNKNADENPIMRDDIVAKYSGTCLSGAGTVYDFLRSQLGFFLVILLPLIIFFLYEAFKFVKNLIEYNKAKAFEEAAKAAASMNANGLTEEQMQEALKNYMEKQNKGKTDSGQKTNDTEE